MRTPSRGETIGSTVLRLWHLPWLAGAIVAVSTVALADRAIRQRSSADLDAYVQQILDRALVVSNASIGALHRAREIDQEACTDEDLNELRLLAFSAPHVRDVGRLRNGRFVCSASWGVLSDAVRMPKPDFQKSGYQFWGGFSGVLDSRIETDMIAFDGVVVATSPRAFEEVVEPAEGRGAMVTTLGGPFAFETFGEVGALALSASGEPLASDGFVTSKACNRDVGICVAGVDRGGGLLGLSAVQCLTLILLSIMGGMGVTVQLLALQRKRSSIERQLARAMERRDIQVMYQPLRRLSDRVLIGVEALARWKNERGINVPPDEFIPIIERLGMTGALARCVVLRSLDDLRPRFLSDPDFYVSINLSAQDAVDVSLKEFIDAELASRGIASSRIVLEITERSTTATTELTEALYALRQSGYRVFIDDFGTGYSNFSYLSEMAIGGLKMDRRFTMAIGTSSVGSQIVGAICAMTTSLGIELVAEGVETEEQAQGVLTLLPTAIGQGWLFGRPCSWADLPTH